MANLPIKRLGILTGGGDVPGLNAAIKALVSRAEYQGVKIIGLRNGWESLTFLNRNLSLNELLFDDRNYETWEHGYVIPLHLENTRTIDRSGGTFLGSTRTHPASMRVATLPDHLRDQFPHQERVDLTAEVLANLAYLQLDGLIVIGGDGTLSYCPRLVQEGFPVWGIPKTMDNDVPGTQYCIGFQTAINRASESITRIRSTAGSHGETVIFRLFGRDAGFTALETSIVSSVDRCLIPEVPADLDCLAEMVVKDRKNPRHYSTIVIAEGANPGMAVPETGEVDAYGHKKRMNSAEFLSKALSNRLPYRFLPIDLIYMLRSGEPDAYDKHMAIFFANAIMSAVEDGITGVMAGARYGEIIITKIPGKDRPARQVNTDDYNEIRYRPNFEKIKGRYVSQE